MTVRIGADSARRVGAQRFGVALREAMKRRKVGAPRLAIAVGCTSSSIGNYRNGRNVPTMATAQRLADVLDAPHLPALAMAARTINCDVCGRSFAVEAGSPQRYCTPECRRVQGKKTTGDPANTRLRAAAAERVLRVHQEAVALMCLSCEPSGLCRTADCALRSVSPLSLSTVSARTLPIPPSERNGEAWRVASLAANARRWTPEERAAQSERTAAMHAKRTPEERQAFAAAVSAGRRRPAA